jgi:hypothetical protein
MSKDQCPGLKTTVATLAGHRIQALHASDRRPWVTHERMIVEPQDVSRHDTGVLSEMFEQLREPFENEEDARTPGEFLMLETPGVLMWDKNGIQSGGKRRIDI